MKQSFKLLIIPLLLLGGTTACNKTDNLQEQVINQISTRKSKPVVQTFDKTSAYNLYDYYCMEYDCVLLDIHPAGGFPNSNSTEYCIYIGERNSDGECTY